MLQHSKKYFNRARTLERKVFNETQNANSRSQKIEHFNKANQQGARRMQKTIMNQQNAKQLAKHEQNNKCKQQSANIKT
jgi:hypothetical protein